MFSHAGFPDWLGCCLIMMLGSDRVFQDLGLDAMELRRRAGWRRRIYVLVYLFRCVEDMLLQLSNLMYWIVCFDDCKYKLFRFLLYKICCYLLYFVPLRLWDSDLCFSSLLPFLLLPLSSFFLTIGFSGIRLFDMLDSEGIYVNFRRSKISGMLHVVSEQMVSNTLALFGNLLIRDRVSSTLEWVLRVIIDMSAYLLVNIKCFILCWLVYWVAYEFWSAQSS